MTTLELAPSRAELVINLYREGTPIGDIANTLELSPPTVQSVLLGAGIDWAPPQKAVGRPITPLRPGAQLFVERAYRSGWSMSKCAVRTDVPVRRVRRHLVDGNVTRAVQPAQPNVREAIQRYLAGDKVLELCHETRVRPPVLYRELRLRDIPLRSQQEIDGV